MMLTVPKLPTQPRLDRFLKDEMPALSRSGFFSALRKGRIRVNGVRVRDPALRLAPGDEVGIESFEAPAKEGTGGDRKPPAAKKGEALHPLFEDEALLVLDKPAGIAVHPGAGRRERTLIDSINAYAAERGFTPFLVHRLDRHTSGLLLVAKSKEIAGKLGRMLKEERRVEKVYLALAFGKAAAEGRIDETLDGREAHTQYQRRALGRWGAQPLSLLEVRILTGRKHQIRRHLASIGLPVVGDELYGAWELNRSFKKEFRNRGFLLHAARITLPHPQTGRELSIEAAMPAELHELLSRLEVLPPI